MEKYYKEKHVVGFDDVDFKGELSFQSIMRLMVRVASLHAEQLGFGYNVISHKNWIWVLSSLNVDVKKIPAFGDEIELYTQPVGARGLSAYRDFKMSMDDKTILTAKSAWLIIDKLTRRPQNAEKYFENMEFEGVLPEPDELKIQEQMNSNILSNRESDIGVSDLDLNGHMNALRYVDRAIDTYTPDDLKQSFPTQFYINFLREARFDDNLHAVRCGLENKKHLIGIYNNDSDKPLAKFLLNWENK